MELWMFTWPGHVANNVQCSILSSIQCVCFKNCYHVWSSTKNKSVICLNRIGFDSIPTCSTQNIGLTWHIYNHNGYNLWSHYMTVSQIYISLCHINIKKSHPNFFCKFQSMYVLQITNTDSINWTIMVSYTFKFVWTSSVWSKLNMS